MPIYEYKCKRCGETFELLVRGSEKPQCPMCSSKSLKKLVSGFSTVSERKARMACGRRCDSPKKHGCCGGCCCGGCHWFFYDDKILSTLFDFFSDNNFIGVFVVPRKTNTLARCKKVWPLRSHIHVGWKKTSVYNRPTEQIFWTHKIKISDEPFRRILNKK